MSKISVALTTFNGEKYIEKQLKSLLFQQRPIDEVIIVDDASSDKTVVIVDEFIKKNNLLNWHLYVNNENIGFLKNFKNAIEKTTGDIIFLCDQDDIWFNTKINSMLNRFESDERIKAIYSGFKFIDENDNIIVDKYQTNIGGLFAGGDIIGGVMQVVKAASDGACAAIEINKYLKK